MSIKLTLSIGTVKTEASLKDSAHNELMQFIFKNQEGAASPSGKPPEGEKPNPALSDSDPVKGWIAKHTASEVLSRIGWETNPEKILLLAAFHEANGGKEGWRSADINERFKQAKEPFPANFPRDIRTAVEAGLVGTVTSRTYRVGRTGWNKIAEAIAKIP